MPRKPTEYNLFVKQFAKDQPGPNLMKRAGLAWRAAGLAKAPPKPKTAGPSRRPDPRGPKGKLAGPLHSCAGLDEDPCDVAPNCYWKPSAKQCATRSGKAVIAKFQGPERQTLLASIRGQNGGW